jgi:hypothetical protein
MASPAPAARPDDLPGRGTTRSVVALLLLFVLIGAGHVVNHFAGYPLRQTVIVGDHPRELPLALPLFLALVAVRLALIVAFLFWVYGAAANRVLLGAAGTDYSPAWAAASFLIPVYNLFGPYLVMQEIWKASAPRGPGEGPNDWPEGKASPTISLWWACCLLAVLPGLLPTQPVENAHDTNLTTGARLGDAAVVLFANAASLLAAGFGAAAVLQIRRRQEERFAKVRQEAARSDTTFGGDLSGLTGDRP